MVPPKKITQEFLLQHHSFTTSLPHLWSVCGSEVAKLWRCSNNSRVIFFSNLTWQQPKTTPMWHFSSCIKARFRDTCSYEKYRPIYAGGGCWEYMELVLKWIVKFLRNLNVNISVILYISLQILYLQKWKFP